MLATLLALGELTSFCRFGSLRYWQRQGLCSFNLLQHVAVGAISDVIALSHAASSSGLHVIAVETRVVSPGSRTIRTIKNPTYNIFIFTHSDKKRSERERGMEMGCSAWASRSAKFIGEKNHEKGKGGGDMFWEMLDI